MTRHQTHRTELHLGDDGLIEGGWLNDDQATLDFVIPGERGELTLFADRRQLLQLRFQVDRLLKTAPVMAVSSERVAF